MRQREEEDLGVLIQHRPTDVDRRRLARVSSVSLEGEAEDSNLLVVDGVEPEDVRSRRRSEHRSHGVDDELSKASLLMVIHADDLQKRRGEREERQDQVSCCPSRSVPIYLQPVLGDVSEASGLAEVDQV